MHRPASVLALAVTVTIALASCTGSAPTSGPSASAVLPTATPAAAAPTGEPSPASPSTAPTTDPSPTKEATMPPFTLRSSAISVGGSIPRRFTCDGEDVSPDLEWDGVPPNTAALVLVVDDPDARDFVHWTVLDMDGSLSGALPLGVSTSPDAPRQGANDFGRVGWGGPCPPSGEHRYRFTLYALAAPLGLPGTPRSSAVRAGLGAATVVGTATFEARYRRGG